MAIPGSNLLRTAMRTIATQNIEYYKFRARESNEVGQYQAVYYPKICIKGSVQPVPRTIYVQMGLDFQKSYRNFFVPQSIFDIARDISGDQMVFASQIYQCISKTDWASVDGWVEVLCVQVPPLATGPA